MKKRAILYFLLTPFLLVSCSSDDKVEVDKVQRIVESFEGNDVTLSGPTSEGKNLYDIYTHAGEDPEFPRFKENTKNPHISYGVEMAEEKYNFHNGGVAVSNWNIYEGPDNDWYHYTNQMSVFNTESVSGENKKAGHTGNNFAVINYSGYNDAGGVIRFKDDWVRAKSVWVCNTAYVAGTILYGNEYSQPLKENKGYFKLIAKAYDKAGDVLATDEIYLADYRENSEEILIDKWTKFELTNIAAFLKISEIRFSLEGSDMGQYGLNTPSYVAIDDLSFEIEN